MLLSPQTARAAKPSADEAYGEARTGYYALKGDAARRKLRHHWLNVAKKFEQVAARYPKSPRAPEALFTSGDLLAELSRFSAQQPDLDQAVADYGRLLDLYPGHRLADDAALALAKVAVDRKDDVAQARKVLEQGLAKTPKGDRAREMKALLA
ncbi:MAG: tetratricopeptide repeat protein, partial [Myxococcaceae bacterium]